MADAIFDTPRLAGIYDLVDGDRADLDAYVALVDEFGARSVLDIGCGTGTFACRLAGLGAQVTAIDPAGASLAVAREKPHADRVRWLHGDATALPPLQVDLVTMTGNVVQALLTDEEFAATLCASRAALRPGGLLVFETRDAAREPWREWTRERSRGRVPLPEGGELETWLDVTEVRPPFVSFRHTFVFGSDPAALTSDSTLRFRSRQEIHAALQAAGFILEDVRDAPDRPGREFVFVARRPPGRQ